MSPALHAMPRLSLAGLGGIAHALAVYPLFQFLNARQSPSPHGSSF